jgi:serine/threonine-protein phosphatase 2A regulatory subunit A
LTVEVLISIAEVVPKDQHSSHAVLLTTLKSLIGDKSWRVRYMVANRFEKVTAMAKVLVLFHAYPGMVD